MVDLDIVHGSSTVVITYRHISLPYTIHDYELELKTQVVGDLVLGWTPTSFTLIDVVTGKIARIRKDVCHSNFSQGLTVTTCLAMTQENLELLNFDIVRNTAVFIIRNATFRTPSIYIAKVPRIFAYSRADPGEPTWLRNICEAIVNIPVEPTEMSMNMDDSCICDPSRWGSPLPCRVLFLQAGIVGDAEQFKVHRHLHVLTFDQETSTPILEPGGALTSVIPPDYLLMRLVQTPSGHSVVCCEDFQSEDVNKRSKKFTILSSTLPPGNLIPINESPQRNDAIYCRIERYSGTVWYRHYTEAKDTIKLEYFN